MAKILLLGLVTLIALNAVIECEIVRSSIYKITKLTYGSFEAELAIPLSQPLSSGWELELHFDDMVILHVYQSATIKSNKDEKVYLLTNDATTASVSNTLTIKFTVNYDKDAGANLIAAKLNGKSVDIGKVPTSPQITIPSIGSKGNYDYGLALHASLLFYEAQRSGKLPADNRIKWRGDSMLDDKGDNGEDLTGGYFDAGDLVKFGLPMAYTITVLSWGVIDYEDGYVKAGELENVHKAIKWGTDYFIKCHVKEREFYGQVGDGDVDHAVWGRPEDWPKEKGRPAFKITDSKPGTELAGETAAAMAAASMVFRKSDPTYSAKLLTHAKQLYDFANEKRAKYSDSITKVAGFYRSFSGYGDELGWAAAWLLRATNDTKYKTDFEKHWAEFKLDSMETGSSKIRFFWDEKTPGLQILIARITGEEKYKKVAQTFTEFLSKSAPRTPKGLIFYAEIWGSLRHSSNAALLLLQAADIGINAAEYRALAKAQIDYALGDAGHSFVVGVGVNPPQKPHHRAASCPTPPAGCDYFAMGNPGPNPQILTGALVGGPDINDGYTDKRDDYVHNEVACDFNAGFQSATAGLNHLKAKGLL